METIKLYELVKETTRVMRFLDNPIHVDAMLGNNTTIHCLMIKYIVSEPEHTLNEQDIDDINKLKLLDVFTDVVNPRGLIDIKGQVIVLSRRDGFVEISVNGWRRIPTLLPNDFCVTFHDPIRRTIPYIIETYPDIQTDVLNAVKTAIDNELLLHEKSRFNLSRLINFIHEFETANDSEMDLMLLTQKRIISTTKNPDVIDVSGEQKDF